VPSEIITKKDKSMKNKHTILLFSMIVAVDYGVHASASLARTGRRMAPVVYDAASRGFVSMTTPEIAALNGYGDFAKTASDRAPEFSYTGGGALKADNAMFTSLKGNKFAELAVAKDTYEYDLARRGSDDQKFNHDVAKLEKAIEAAGNFQNSMEQFDYAAQNEKRRPKDVNKKLRLEFDSNRMKQYKNAQALEDMQKQKLEYDDAILSDYKGRYAGYKYTNNDKIFSSNYDKDLSAHTTKNYGMDKFAFNAALNLAKDLSEEIKADKEAIDRDQAAVQADKNKFDSFVRSPRFQKSGFALPSGKTQESPVAQIVDAEYSYDENGNNIGVEKGGYRNSKGEIQEID
jgi:hypothetical protein